MRAIIISVMALIFSSSSRRCGNVCKRSKGRSCGKQCLRAVGKLTAFPSGREYLFSIGEAAVFHISIGLRVTEEEEIMGLDSCEHGLPSAYAGFSIMDVSNTMTMEINANTDLGLGENTSGVPVPVSASAASQPSATPSLSTGIYSVSIISRLSNYDRLKKAMNDIGVTGMTVTQVMGCGIQKGAGEKYRGVEMDATLLPKVKVDVIVGNIPVDRVIQAAKKALFTGHIGDGKIFVYPVDKVVKIRTGEENLAALNDVE